MKFYRFALVVNLMFYHNIHLFRCVVTYKWKEEQKKTSIKFNIVFMMHNAYSSSECFEGMCSCENIPHHTYRQRKWKRKKSSRKHTIQKQMIRSSSSTSAKDQESIFTLISLLHDYLFKHLTVVAENKTRRKKTKRHCYKRKRAENCSYSCSSEIPLWFRKSFHVSNLMTFTSTLKTYKNQSSEEKKRKLFRYNFIHLIHIWFFFQ